MKQQIINIFKYSLCGLSVIGALLAIACSSGSGAASSSTPTGSSYYLAANLKSSSITSCQINSANGGLGNCTAYPLGESYPTSMGIIGNYAYLSTIPDFPAESNDITLCLLNSATGSVESCSISYSLSDSISGISGNNGFLYLSDISDNSIKKCLINPANGQITGCNTESSVNIIDPGQSTFWSNWAYIPSTESGFILSCSIESITGELVNCTPTGSNLDEPIAIAINQYYAYTINQGNGSVTRCDINNGLLNNCSIISEGFDNPASIVINNNYAYITNLTTNDTSPVTVCAINSSNGNFNNCSSSGNNFDIPNGAGIIN